MPKPQAKTAFKKEFIERIARARKARGYTQQEIADLLGIDQGNYKQYESRTFLPHDLVPKFCLACAIDTGWLFTGKGRMPVGIPAASEPAKRRNFRRKVKAA